MLARPWLALLALALLVPGVLAAETAPVLVERVDAGGLVADAGSPANASFELRNLNPTTDFFVSVASEGPDGWRVTAEPTDFVIPRRLAAEPVAVPLLVHFEPGEPPRDAATFQVTISLVSNATGEVTKVVEQVVVGSAAPPRVMGLVPNPLGPPLDNAYGSFLLSMAGWLVVAVVAMVVGSWVVRVLTIRAARYVSSEMASKLRLPLFLFVLSIGLSESAALLPRNFLTDTVVRIVLAIGVGVFGLYVLYKTLDAGLYYYQKEIAPRTETNIDDVVVPVVRKVGVVVLWVVGIVLSLRQLGWDPTIIFAGAGIAGLVIAFAAQDTFSNLFSGVFLMLDRPFMEGDIVLLETGEVARVERIGLRTTKLYEYDHHHSIILPNNQLATKRVVNYSAPDPFFKVDLFVGAPHDADPKQVERVLHAIAAAEPDLVQEGPWAPQVQLRNFDELGMQFMLRVTLKDPRERNRVPSKLRFAIKEAFAREGIEIPFPHRTLVVKGEGAAKVLRPTGGDAKAKP